MKWIFYLAALTAALLFPVERADVAKLQPVELVCMYLEVDQIVLETDTGDLGKGATVADALRNLEETTPGIVYLDTAAYLLVSDDAQMLIPEITPYLKDKVRVCRMEGHPDLEMAAAYLNVHTPMQVLGSWTEESPLQILWWEEDRLSLKNA